MKLPAFPELTPEVLRALLAKHKLAHLPLQRLPDVGIFNAIFAVGDELILRIPRQHEAFIATARKEALAVPAARAARVRTPELLRFDDALDILPVPHSLYRREQGVNLGQLQLGEDAAAPALRELGRDLALLHSQVAPSAELSALEIENLGTPEAWLERLLGDGYLSELEQAWLGSWLQALALARPAPASVFLHGDIQLSNVLVSQQLQYLALLDWGAAGWGDPACDFAGLPLRLVPYLLEGYEDVLPGSVDEDLRARILYRHLHLALLLLGRPPQAGRSWAERPQGMMLEVMRFFAAGAPPEWRDLRPR